MASTMCNVVPQTAVLNECKWDWLDQALLCLGKFEETLTFSGSLGPYKKAPQLRENFRCAEAVSRCTTAYAMLRIQY